MAQVEDAYLTIACDHVQMRADVLSGDHGVSAHRTRERKLGAREHMMPHELRRHYLGVAMRALLYSHGALEQMLFQVNAHHIARLAIVRTLDLLVLARFRMILDKIKSVAIWIKITIGNC